MLSLREANLKSGNIPPIGLRQLGESKKLFVPLSLKQVIAACFIDEYWYKLRGPQSVLGRPMGNVSAQDADSHIRIYRGGFINFSDITGPSAFQEKVTEIHFTRLECTDESCEKSERDEPYGVIAVYAPETGKVLSVTMIPDNGGGHYSVDAGNSYSQGTGLIWLGPPQPLKIVCVIMENDNGDVQAIKNAIRDNLQNSINVNTEDLPDDMTLVSDFGYLGDLANFIYSGIGLLLGLGDDFVGLQLYPLDKPYIEYKELIDPALHPGGRFTFSVRVDGGDDEGAYNLYFEVVTFEKWILIGPV